MSSMHTIPIVDYAAWTEFVKVHNELRRVATQQHSEMMRAPQCTHSERLVLAHLDALLEGLELDVLPLSHHLFTLAHHFDFADVRANGYRSFLKVTQKCCVMLISNLRSMNKNAWFSIRLAVGDVYGNFVAFCQCLQELSRCLMYLVCLAHMSLEFHNSGKILTLKEVKATILGVPMNLSPQALLSQTSPYSVSASSKENSDASCAPVIPTPHSLKEIGTKRTILSLFLPRAVQDRPETDEFLASVDQLRQEVFYGRCVGFQYCGSAKNILFAVSSMMAGYAEQYEREGHTGSSVRLKNQMPDPQSKLPSNSIHSSDDSLPQDSAAQPSSPQPPQTFSTSGPPGTTKGTRLFTMPLQELANNFLDPERRGHRMAQITRHAPIQFCKQFWGLSDSKLALHMPLLVVPSVDVAHNFSVPMKQLRLRIKENDSPISIPPPINHRGPNVVRLRVLCTRLREGLRWCHAKRGAKNRPLGPDVAHGHIHTGAEPVIWERDSTPEAPPSPLMSPLLPHPLSSSDSPLSSSASSFDPLGSAANSTEVSAMGQFINTFLSRSVPPPSPWLLFHCHGGGFVGQSAQAHDVYLRLWAERLDCPVVSVDYSLAPEYPFPQAVEEVFYAYCWVLAHARRYLGTTLERIVLVGDSAGGNLVLSLMQKLVQFGLPVPSGILLAYTPVHVSFKASPSRLLSIMDPLLPVGILSRCLLAYAGIDEKKFLKEYEESLARQEDLQKEKATTSSSDEDTFDMLPDGSGPYSARRWCSFLNPASEEDVDELHPEESPLTVLRKANLPEDPLMSPYLMEDVVLAQFPRMVIVACHLDPLLDDCVEFAKRCRAVNVPVKLHVLDDDIPHGFLNLVFLSPECRLATEECLRHLRQLFMADGQSAV